LHATAIHGLTRFVGRQTELETLGQALGHADSGHGQVVTVVGEPGVGKSRLFYEFLRSHRMQGWLVLESASVSYGKATPYFPVLDLVKRYCHIEDSDEPRTVRAKVTGQVLTLDAVLQDTVPALLALLDVLPADDPFLQSDPSQRHRTSLARWIKGDIARRYPGAREDAADETGLALSTFPETCPWAAEELLDHGYWPGEEE
jgi:predicted ATPase